VQVSGQEACTSMDVHLCTSPLHQMPQTCVLVAYCASLGTGRCLRVHHNTGLSVMLASKVHILGRGDHQRRGCCQPNSQPNC
jgi:hypothetical protein